jgi:hypothetical protein
MSQKVAFNLLKRMADGVLHPVFLQNWFTIIDLLVFAKRQFRGSKVQGSRFRVQSSGFKGSGFKGSGFKGSGFKGSGFTGSGFNVQGWGQRQNGRPQNLPEQAVFAKVGSNGPLVLMGQRKERGCHKAIRVQREIPGARNELLNL